MTLHTGKRLLVTGASGFLGWNLCRYAAPHYTVMGLGNHHPVHPDTSVALQGDLSDPQLIRSLFSRYSPDAIIHTAAAADPNFCQNNPEKATVINVTATVALARQCEAAGIPFIFTSSDLVFDETRPPYHENDPVCPLSSYGQMKAATEQVCMEVCSSAIICRMPLMYGDAPPHAKSFIHPMIAAMRSGAALSLFTDEFRTPLSATDAAEGILLLLENNCRGIFHLGGPQRVSRFDMGVLIAEVSGITAVLKNCRQKDVPMPAPRAADVSLDSSKAAEFGFKPNDIREELAKLECLRSVSGNPGQ